MALGSLQKSCLDAAKANSTEACLALLEDCPDRQVVCDVFYMALKGGFSDLAMQLVESGKVGVDEPSQLGQARPLHYAAQYGDADVCMALVRRGANVHLREEYMFSTPFEIAIQFRALAVMSVLIEEGGADVNACNGFKEPPLLLAMTNKHDVIPTCQLLMQRGAHVNQSLAITNPNRDLLRHPSVLSVAAHLGNLDLIKMMCTYANVDASTPIYNRGEVSSEITDFLIRLPQLTRRWTVSWIMLSQRRTLLPNWPEVLVEIVFHQL